MLIMRDDPHKEVECYFCLKKGHYASHCALRAQKDAERAAEFKATGRITSLRDSNPESSNLGVKRPYGHIGSTEKAPDFIKR